LFLITVLQFSPASPVTAHQDSSSLASPSLCQAPALILNSPASIPEKVSVTFLEVVQASESAPGQFLEEVVETLEFVLPPQIQEKASPTKLRTNLTALYAQLEDIEEEEKRFQKQKEEEMKREEERQAKLKQERMKRAEEERQAKQKREQEEQRRSNLMTLHPPKKLSHSSSSKLRRSMDISRTRVPPSEAHEAVQWFLIHPGHRQTRACFSDTENIEARFPSIAEFMSPNHTLYEPGKVVFGVPVARERHLVETEFPFRLEAAEYPKYWKVSNGFGRSHLPLPLPLPPSPSPSPC
jgi:hypothetical protein